MLRINVKDSLSEEPRRLVTKEVCCPDCGPGCPVSPLEILLGLPGAAEAQVPKLPLRGLLHLTLGVILVGPGVLSCLVSQHESSLHFPHHKNVTEWIPVSVKLVGYLIRVSFTKDFPSIRLRPLHSVAEFRKYRS